MDKQVAISVDQENNAEDWWTAALAADKTGIPASCLGLLGNGQFCGSVGKFANGDGR